MAPLVLAAFLMLVSAGCVETLGPSGIQSGYDVRGFQDFTWADPVAHDGNGNLVQGHELMRDPSVQPAYVPSLIPRAGPEPNIGVDSHGSVFVSTLDQTQRSTDHGKSWEVIWDLTTPNFPNTQDRFTGLDPMLWVDPDTDRLFVAHLQWLYPGPFLRLPWCVYVAYSDDAGKTWSDKSQPLGAGVVPGQGSCLVPMIDHQKIMTAKPGPRTSPLWMPSRGDYPNIVYLCYNKYAVVGADAVGGPQDPQAGTWCEESFDGGRAFSRSQLAHAAAPGCTGINGHPAAYADGTIVVPISGAFGCLEPPTVVVSEDSGQTWATRIMTNRTVGQVEIDPDVTVTPDGTAYLVFRGKDQLTYLVRSRDKFETWAGPWRVSPPGHTLNTFTGITSGDDGRIAIAFLGTSDPQAAHAVPSNATGGTVWHAFVTTSLNADAEEPLFFTQQVTPNEDPVQIGCIWLSGGAGGPKRCRNLLDFIDVVSDKEGRVYVAVTDGCTPRSGCTADTESVNYQSHDREAAAIIQDSGLSLRSASGTLSSFGLQHPRPLPR